MQKNSLTKYWLLTGAGALAVAGLYALVLVVARTPQLAAMPLFKKLFHEALVVHVDLSVLVWFLSIACLLWSRLTAGSRAVMPYLEEAALISMVLGTLAIALSPLDPAAEALMSNYIPVIYSPIFFFGLSLIGCAVLLMLVKVLCSLPSRGRAGVGAKSGAGENRAPLLTSPLMGEEITFALHSAGLITFASLIAFFWSHRLMPGEIDGQQYYDMMFWGGGHILQFTHVQMVMICWLLLANALQPVTVRGMKPLFSIGLISAAAGLALYPMFDITSMQHRDNFTYLMILANGIAPMILALWLLPGLWRQRALRLGDNRAVWSALMASLLLFIYGGVLGGLITGQNVVIPAHYHGSIVGVTLGFMGLAYLLLPEFGYRNVASWRMAYWQPIVYGIGQVMHISGLAYSGGYGVLRKTPAGEMMEIALPVKAALGFMGLGGLIAIIGGLMFVIVIAKAIVKAERPAAA